MKSTGQGVADFETPMKNLDLGTPPSPCNTSAWPIHSMPGSAGTVDPDLQPSTYVSFRAVFFLWILF